MTAPSPVSLATLEDLETAYASPASIPADIQLAELETIRAGWIAQARAQQIPKRLFEIAYWLGAESPTHYGGTHRLLDNGSIRIWATIVTDKRNIPLYDKHDILPDDWNMTRRLTAYLDNQRILVMDWSWSFHAENFQSERLNEKEGAGLLYIPGAWVTLALAMQARAEQARIGFARNADAARRDELARRMLVGREI
jgi:hypothetical protein